MPPFGLPRKRDTARAKGKGEVVAGAEKSALMPSALDKIVAVEGERI